MKIKLDASDTFFEVVAVISVFACVIIIAATYSGLPDVIPNHFDLNGFPNRYGSKNALWAVVAVSVFIYILMGVIAMFPESLNYPAKKNDKESQYKLGIKLLRSLKACILLFIALMSFIMIQSAKTGMIKGTFWIISIVPAILLVNLIWFFVRWKKIK